ncbi:MAG: glycosyl transferase [Candidatus Angelobacter sp.]|nr:glycosyl transferase [Candidatus Angelobacter sp.]
MAVPQPALTDPLEQLELSVVLPCLDEAETITACVNKALQTLKENGILGEVIVADNGSTDESHGLARTAGAKVVIIGVRGYGAAVKAGVSAARGKYVVMADADDSYDFSHIPRFLDELRKGSDLVVGNRFKGGIASDAMPPLHRYLGNPVLSLVGRLLFKSPCGDFHCGMRGFTREGFEKLQLRTTGMEFASEMIVKASFAGLTITEVPTTLSPDGRSRRSHLRTWRDGWRHLRFLFLYCPRWLFLYPGLLLMILGLGAGALLLPSARTIGQITFDVHTLLYAAMCVLLGFQAVTFAIFTKVFAITEGLLPPDERLNRLFKYINLEVGLAVGALLVVAGTGLTFHQLDFWSSRHFGPLNPSEVLRAVIPAVLSITLGVQVIFNSFFLSVLGLSRV